MKRLNSIEEILDVRKKMTEKVSKNLDVFIKTQIAKFSDVQNTFSTKFKDDLTKSLQANLRTPLKDIVEVQKMVIRAIRELKNRIPKDMMEEMYVAIERLENTDFSAPVQLEMGQPGTEPSVALEGLPQALEKGKKGKKKRKKAEKEAEKKEIPPDTDWSDSELEGFKIYDEVIAPSKWKVKDFEKQKGTREMFAIAWHKLSGPARKEIRNGAWSKKIIIKIVMLGRERHE